MTQPFDEQLTRAFDSLRERLHAQIADQCLGTTQQIAGAAESERRAAAEAAARDAAAQRDEHLAQLAELRAAAAQTAEHHADALAALGAEHETRVTMLGAERESTLASLRREHERAQTALRAEHESVLASLRAEYDADLTDARAELDAARLHVQAAHADAQAALAAAAARAGAAAVPVQTGAGNASHARVLHDVRALDAASSLSQTLDALFAAARAEARRVAVFLVRGDLLRTWNHAGFDAVPGGSSFDLPLADAGLIADVVRSSASRRIAAGNAARPAFAATSPASSLVAVPLSMNGQVIAVLCAEEDAGSADALTPTFEVLARHAARVLESLTALRFAQLVPPAGAGAPPPR